MFSSEGARLRAYDPGVKTLPKAMAASIELCDSPAAALNNSDGAVFTTLHPNFKGISRADLSAMKRPWILDPNGILSRSALDALPGIQYYAVGFQHGGRK